MVSAIILAGGTGQRMGMRGLPKQFLKLYGRPIICYTLRVFQDCPDVDEIIIPCNEEWIEHMKGLVREFNFSKVKKVISGGKDRQSSMIKGLLELEDPGDDDIVIIHDGVRPLVKESVIVENISVAREKGNAMTVKPSIETIVVTASNDDAIVYDDFKPRDVVYTLTAPQTFKTKELLDALTCAEGSEELLKLPDASLLYAKLGKEVFLVKDSNLNLKITTPEDYYYLKSYLELNESKQILGIGE